MKAIAGCLRSRLPGLGLPILLLAIGCGAPTGRVTGTVTFDGKPLPAGVVTFLCDGGARPVIGGKISENGGYEIANLPVGRARVSVQTFATQPKPPPGIDPTTGREFSDGWVDQGPYVPIPHKYSSPKISGLEHTIVPGDQTFDITLKK